MFLQLDDKGPRYLQLARALKQAILDGRCAPGTRLPATRTLARELEISRNTTLAAYALLTEEGLIEGRSGSGCYVATFAAAAKRPVATPAHESMRAPALSRRGRRMQQVYDRAIPGRQHRGLRYNLQYGLPMTNPQLASAWRRALNQAAAHVQTDYPDPQGLPELRTQICEYLARRRGISATADDVLIVNGTQQAFSLAADVLLDAGDRMLLEDPHYQGARQVFAARGAVIRTCRVDGDGLVTHALPRDSRTRLAVVTPSHQFPTGAVLSLPRRMQLLDWAQRRRCWLIEDDYDGEFRYDRQPVGALQGMAPENVVYVGTAAKTLSPTLRLAWMVLPDRLVEPVAQAKRLTDLHTGAIGQLTLAELITSHSYDRHIRACRLHYRRRRDLLIERLGHHHRLRGIAAGLHALIHLPAAGPSEEELVERAAARGLAVSALGPHWHTLGRTEAQGLIVGYATPDRASYPAALDTLARTLHGN